MRGERRGTIVFSALAVWCVALVAVRMSRTGTIRYGFLYWNLFLAFVPLWASNFVRAAYERRMHAVVQWAAFALWLVFLPNAPYVITDLIHLQPRPPVPLWYDLAVIASCAGTSLLAGYKSLANVQSVVAHRFNALAGWLVAIAALALSGFGIYLGRFLRWNSWDVVAEPHMLLLDVIELVLHPRANPLPVLVTVIYGGALILGYLALTSVAYDRGAGSPRTKP